MIATMSKYWQQRESACNDNMQELATVCKNLQQLASTCNDEQVLATSGNDLQQGARAFNRVQAMHLYTSDTVVHELFAYVLK